TQADLRNIASQIFKLLSFPWFSQSCRSGWQGPDRLASPPAGPLSPGVACLEREHRLRNRTAITPSSVIRFPLKPVTQVTSATVWDVILASSRVSGSGLAISFVRCNLHRKPPCGGPPHPGAFRRLFH